MVTILHSTTRRLVYPKIIMSVFKKLFTFLIQRSTLALFGAFLIHVTLGTIYTLSNINSYLTSYMRKHGTPGATYGGSMWISSSYAVGQGLSMILGGMIEKRFSARVACFLGCALHSLSVMSTSRSIDYGQLAVLVTYGFLPGFGCGLAYMTPMSNGFGWFPNRKGLVAGTILAGFGIGTFVFNMAQTAYVNPHNLSPLPGANGYFTQDEILDNVPHLFTFLGTIYACMQFVGCCLLFKPPHQSVPCGYKSVPCDERPILADEQQAPTEMSFKKAIRTREFFVLFLVFGITNQGVLFVNSMLKEYAQIFISDDLYLAWTGSMASIANSLGRLVWGLAIDRYSFTICFTLITTIFGTLIFLMPFEFILSSKLLYLLCTLGIFGSFSGWMSTYPVHLSRTFGTRNSGMIYGLIFVSQSIGGILTAFAAHYLIDHYTRFVPFFCVTFLEVLGLSIYHLFYVK
uniref:Inner membrane protein yhjX n=1 Tax=Aceria tosichella TaxID=561515 RepID=A0A6G1S359_9ACAR